MCIGCRFVLAAAGPQPTAMFPDVVTMKKLQLGGPPGIGGPTRALQRDTSRNRSLEGRVKSIIVRLKLLRGAGKKRGGDG